MYKPHNSNNMSKFNLTQYDNVKFIVAARITLEEIKKGDPELHYVFAETYKTNDFEAFTQITSTLTLIKNAETMSVSIKDAMFENYKAQIGLAKELVNLFMKRMAQELLNTLVLVSASKAESTNDLTINYRQFLQIANAGKKQWNDIEAILAVAEYIASDGCSPDIHSQWLNDWVAKEKLIPAIQNFLKRA